MAKETEIIDNPIKNWNMLSWEQLQRVAQTWSGADEEYIKRLNVLLVCMGWEIVGAEWQLPTIDRIISMSDEELEQEMASGKAWDALAEAQQFLQGDGDAVVEMRGKSGEMFAIEADNLKGAAIELTKWLDEPQQLRALPVEYVKVGKHEYKMPRTALVDVEFEQFQEAQKYEERVWMMLRRVKELLGIKDETSADADLESEGADAPLGETVDTEGTVAEKELTDEEKKEVVELVGEIKKAKAQFLCQMLVRKEWKGWKIVRDECKVWGMSVPVFKVRGIYECAYSGGEDDVCLADMMEAPEWLYGVVEQYMQGCVAFYASQYKAMFKKSGNDGNEKAPLIARLDMVNTLMKYQGFSCQDVVRKMKVPDAFSIMNAMSKEAEEVEKMKRESERKRK